MVHHYRRLFTVLFGKRVGESSFPFDVISDENRTDHPRHAASFSLAGRNVRKLPNKVHIFWKQSASVFGHTSFISIVFRWRCGGDQCTPQDVLGTHRGVLTRVDLLLSSTVVHSRVTTVIAQPRRFTWRWQPTDGLPTRRLAHPCTRQCRMSAISHCFGRFHRKSFVLKNTSVNNRVSTTDSVVAQAQQSTVPTDGTLLLPPSRNEIILARVRGAPSTAPVVFWNNACAYTVSV